MLQLLCATWMIFLFTYEEALCVDHGPFEHPGFLREERMLTDVSCLRDEDCETVNGFCKDGGCTCPDSYVINGRACVPGALLGSSCLSHSQCSARVPQSHCLDGICQCKKDLIKYKKHLCLKPAEIGQDCHSHDQCTFKNPSSYCKFIVPKVYGRCQCQPPLAYTISQGCIEPSNSTDFKGEKEYRELSHVQPVSLGHPCTSDDQCQLADPESSCKNGVCECINMGKGLCQAKQTGCYPDTFQCRSSGRCISRLLVCNGRADCDDGSDEECSGPICPPTTFGCRSKDGGFRCLSSSARCDGKKQCSDGSDEFGCVVRNNTICPSQTYQCKEGSCVPEYAFCNAIVSCPDGSDEDENACRKTFEPVRVCPFRCKNGRCRSKSVLCSGADGCGDNSDEQKCQICKCANRGSAQIIASSSSWHIIQKRRNWLNRLF